MGRSNSEVGHAKTEANWSEVVRIAEKMDTLFNPGIPEIQMVHLKEVENKLKDNNNAYKLTIPLFKNAIAERAALYAPLNKKGTRLQNSFLAFSFGEQVDAPLISLTKKLRGERIIKIKKDKPEEEETETISISQTSFDNKADTFDSMIKYVEANPNFKPNEDEMQPDALKVYYKQIMEANKKASNASIDLIKGRKLRDEILYDGTTNVIDLVRKIKKYLKSLEGADEYYKMVVKLKFKSKAP